MYCRIEHISKSGDVLGSQGIKEDSNKYLFIYKYFYLFLERGGEGEREEEKHQCVIASCVSLLGTWPATRHVPYTGN